MARKAAIFIFNVVLFIGLLSSAFLPALREQAGALEKLKWSTPVKTNASYFLPPLAVEERGFAKENGLELEWVPFGGSAPQMAATAAGAISIGGSPIGGVLPVTPRVPLAMVGEFAKGSWFIYVKTDSPYRELREMKGKRFAVTGLGGSTHAYGQIVVKAFGLEKDARFVGTGSPPAMYAALKAGAVEAMVFSLASAFPMKIAGEIREIVSVDDYLPKPWVEDVIFVRKDFARSKPDVVRKAIRANFQAISFLKANPRWALDKIKSLLGLSEEAAKLLYDTLNFTTTGRIDRKAVENVRRLFIEYGVITEKTPAVDELFTNEYVS